MEALKHEAGGEIFSDSRGQRYYLSVVRGRAFPINNEDDLIAAREADKDARVEVMIRMTLKNFPDTPPEKIAELRRRLREKQDQTLTSEPSGT